jgi:4'-phosphopantetheinyl transferase
LDVNDEVQDLSIELSRAVALLSIDLESMPIEAAQLFARLSPDERQRAERIRGRKPRNYWIRARATLRLLLANYCGLPADELRFSCNDWGKPAIANPSISPYPHFNYSHAGSMALLAISTAGPVGVDMERLEPLSEMDTITRRYFSTSEQVAIASYPKSQRILSFYRVWTRKEAYVKALGIGLSGNLAGFDVSPAPTGNGLLLAVNGNAQAANEWMLADIQIGGDYVAAVAVRARHLPISRYKVLSQRDASDGLRLSIERARDVG